MLGRCRARGRAHSAFGKETNRGIGGRRTGRKAVFRIFRIFRGKSLVPSVAALPLCTATVEVVCRLRRIFGRHRRADILVRSKVERFVSRRHFWSRGAFGHCCGQECPRAGSVAALPRCVLASLRFNRAWFNCTATIAHRYAVPRHLVPSRFWLFVNRQILHQFHLRPELRTPSEQFKGLLLHVQRHFGKAGVVAPAV